MAQLSQCTKAKSLLDSLPSALNWPTPLSANIFPARIFSQLQSSSVSTNEANSTKAPQLIWSFEPLNINSAVRNFMKFVKDSKIPYCWFYQKTTVYLVHLHLVNGGTTVKCIIIKKIPKGWASSSEFSKTKLTSTNSGDRQPTRQLWMIVTWVLFLGKDMTWLSTTNVISMKIGAILAKVTTVLFSLAQEKPMPFSAARRNSK